jgi:hypothetical protein
MLNNLPNNLKKLKVRLGCSLMNLPLELESLTIDADIRGTPTDLLKMQIPLGCQVIIETICRKIIDEIKELPISYEYKFLKDPYV